MYLYAALLPLILALGQPVFSAAVHINIQIDDKQVSNVPTTHSSLDHPSHSTGGLEYFRLRVIDLAGKAVNDVDGAPLYLDFSLVKALPPRLAYKAPYGKTLGFKLSDGKLQIGNQENRAVDVDEYGWMFVDYGLDEALDFTTVYSKSASTQVLAIKKAGSGDGNPDVFMVEGDLKNLSGFPPAYACVPGKTRNCANGKTKVYLKIEEFKDDEQSEL